MSTPEPAVLALATPDPTFRLTAEQRAEVRREFDVDALERLLAAIRPDYRNEIYQEFVHGSSPAPGEWVVPACTAFDEPQLQALLEEVWLPYWDVFDTTGDMDKDETGVPGRELAKARRRAKEQRP